MKTASFTINDWPVQDTHTVSLDRTTFTTTHRITPSHQPIVERDSILDPSFTTDFDPPVPATHEGSADHSSSHKPSSHHSTSAHFTIATQTSSSTGFEYPYPVPSGSSSSSLSTTSSGSQTSMHGMHSTIVGLALTVTFLILITILAFVGWFLIRRRKAQKTRKSEERAIALDNITISAPQPISHPQRPERSYLSRGSMRRKPEGNFI